MVRRTWTLLAVALACLAFAPAAHAALGLQGLSAAPANTNAGANSDLNVHIGFTSPAADVKDLTVGLPPGLVGDPTATPLCTMAQLQADSCPAASQVGTVSTSANAHLLDPLPLTLPLTVDGSLYNVVPAAGQPARFGIVLRPVGSDPLPVLQKIVQVSNVQLRKSDFGLNTVLTDIPNAALAAGGSTSVPIDITAIDIHLNGTVGGAGFMRNPTSCGTKTTKFTATSWANPNQPVTGQAAYTSVNCASLPFSPTFRAWLGAPGRTEFNTKPPMTTLIAQDDGEAGLKDAQVLLPSGSLSANVTPLLNPCGANQFRSDSSRCPRQSIVGTATAGSPFLPAPLSGRVVVVVPPPRGGLWRLGVDLHGPIDLQLLGDFVATATGLGQKFSRLPDIPISAFLLHFKQGGLLVADRDLCEPPAPVFPLDFLGWNSATQTSSVAATVQGCAS